MYIWRVSNDISQFERVHDYDSTKKKVILFYLLIAERPIFMNGKPCNDHIPSASKVSNSMLVCIHD